MPGPDHHQDPARRALGQLLAQPRGHVAVALFDQGEIELAPIRRQFREGGLQDVALLEVLDVLFGDAAPGHQGGEDAAEQIQPPPPSQAPGDPAQGHADLAVDEQQGQPLGRRQFDGAALLGPGFDPEVIRQALLVGAQGQAGHHPIGVPLTDDPQQVQACHGVGVGERLVTAAAELHRHGVVAAAAEQFRDHIGAGPGDMGRAKKAEVPTGQVEVEAWLYRGRGRLGLGWGLGGADLVGGGHG